MKKELYDIAKKLTELILASLAENDDVKALLPEDDDDAEQVMIEALIDASYRAKEAV